MEDRRGSDGKPAVGKDASEAGSSQTLNDGLLVTNEAGSEVGEGEVASPSRAVVTIGNSAAGVLERLAEYDRRRFRELSGVTPWYR